MSCAMLNAMVLAMDGLGTWEANFSLESLRVKALYT